MQDGEYIPDCPMFTYFWKPHRHLMVIHWVNSGSRQVLGELSSFNRKQIIIINNLLSLRSIWQLIMSISDVAVQRVLYYCVIPFVIEIVIYILLKNFGTSLKQRWEIFSSLIDYEKIYDVTSEFLIECLDCYVPSGTMLWWDTTPILKVWKEFTSAQWVTKNQPTFFLETKVCWEF